MKVLGLKELEYNVKRLNDDLAAVVDPAAMAAGEVIAQKWRELVPILEGNFRDSIAVGSLKKKPGQVVVGISWLGNLPRNQQPVMYAKRLEFGDSEITAQPSARPAWKQSQQEAIDAAGVEVGSVVTGRRSRRRRKRTP